MSPTNFERRRRMILDEKALLLAIYDEIVETNELLEKIVLNIGA